MKDHLVKQIMQHLNSLPIREISEMSGIQHTRIHRLRKQNKEMTVTEFFALCAVFGIKLTASEDGFASVTHTLSIDLEKHKAAITAQAFKEVYDQAELKVAQSHGLTVEAMKWRLTAPNKAV